MPFFFNHLRVNREVMFLASHLETKQKQKLILEESSEGTVIWEDQWATVISAWYPNGSDFFFLIHPDHWRNIPL